MKIAVCQINSIIGDIEGNKKKIIDGYKQATSNGADLAVFPELALVGYPPLDLVTKNYFRKKCAEATEEIGKLTNNTTALIFGSITESDIAGLSQKNDGEHKADGSEKAEKEKATTIFNSALFCFRGEIKRVINKTLIPEYDIFHESRYFSPAEKSSVFTFKGEIIGVTVCEDIWNHEDRAGAIQYPIDPIEEQLEAGAELLINISASPFDYGKRTAKYEMLRKISRNNGVKIVYVNCAAAQTDLIFDGASMCFNKTGNLLKLGKLFSEDYFIFDTNATTAANLTSSLKESATTHSGFAASEKSKASAVSNPTSGATSVVDDSSTSGDISTPIVTVERSFEEEVHDAIIFGIKDYCAKLNFKTVCLGLSGGIDSAIVAYFGAKAVGPENVFVTLMPSEFTTDSSTTDALKLINNLRIQYNSVSIQPVFEKTKEMLKLLFGNTPEDVTEENMQSRIRGLYMMSISNKFGHLLLTTGNKSELATGYATLYGDMVGGLAVIGDVFKTDIYRICEYINRNEEIIPREIIEKVPSAELRHNQTDQDSLPPYPVLDKMLKLYIEENKEIDEISALTGDEEMVRQFLNMVDRNEFKRNQGAPVLRVSKKAFGSGRKFPIVQKWRR